MKKKKSSNAWNAFVFVSASFITLTTLCYLLPPFITPHEPKFIKGDCIREEDMDYITSIKILSVGGNIYCIGDTESERWGILDIKKTDERFHRVSCD